jgi:hypothetical protein|uniref:Uncharacterized protein n=1 Tax=candidate division WOR-3 bacterium TaxID=2052148 RepID=A0A7C6A9T7_UNCW3
MSFKVRKFLILLNLSLLTIGCKSDKVLYRATSDYFPLKPGMVWKYINNNDTSVVEVIGDTFVLGHYCILVYHNYLEEFWIKDKTEIKKFVDKKLNRAGYDYILERQFRRYFPLPLIKGSSWYEDYQNRVDVLGDTIYIKHAIAGRINGWGDITTPAGNFTEVYNITLIDSLRLNDSLLVETSHYWLAPEIGIVRYAIPDTFELVQFTTSR